MGAELISAHIHRSRRRSTSMGIVRLDGTHVYPVLGAACLVNGYLVPPFVCLAS